MSDLYWLTDEQMARLESYSPKSHPTASSLRVLKGGLGRLIGRNKGGMNTKLHALSEARGRPISLFMTAGQVSDYTGAAGLLDCLCQGPMVAERQRRRQLD